MPYEVEQFDVPQPTEHAEEVMKALAGCISWRKFPDMRSWHGETERAEYTVSYPHWHEDIDMNPSKRSWTFDVMPSERAQKHGNFAGWYTGRTATAEEAKAICQRYDWSGDPTEIETNSARFRTVEQAFKAARNVAETPILAACHAYKPPRLKWYVEDTGGETVLYYSPVGTHGMYKIQFAADCRWIVRRIEKNPRVLDASCFAARLDSQGRWRITLMKDECVLQERCFFNLQLAKIACALHVHTGDWHGGTPVKENTERADADAVTSVRAC